MRKNSYYLLLDIVIVVVAMWVGALLSGILPADAGTFAEAESEIVTNVEGPWYTVGAVPLLLLSGSIVLILIVISWLAQIAPRRFG